MPLATLVSHADLLYVLLGLPCQCISGSLHASLCVFRLCMSGWLFGK